MLYAKHQIQLFNFLIIIKVIIQNKNNPFIEFL